MVLKKIRGIALAMALMLLCSPLNFMSACSLNDSEPAQEVQALDLSSTNETEIASVWTTYSTAKILQDQQITAEDKKNTDISIFMAKNEFESGQFIISAKKAIKDYKITVGDITHTNGVDKITDIDVFVEKYIEVTQVYDTGIDAPTGWYPDALVPYHAIIEEKENNIAAGKNQGRE